MKFVALVCLLSPLVAFASTNDSGGLPASVPVAGYVFQEKAASVFETLQAGPDVTTADGLSVAGKPGSRVYGRFGKYAAFCDVQWGKLKPVYCYITIDVPVR